MNEAGRRVAFVLVPGGDVELGFDGRGFTPSARQARSFAETARHFDIEPSLSKYLDAHTSVPRCAQIAPLLVEAEPRPVPPRADRELLPPDHPRWAAWAEDFDDLLETQVASIFDAVTCTKYEVQRAENGVLQAWRCPDTTVDDVVRQLAGSGMRLLTSDEWEHVCGAGADTLFRWGNEAPADFYPDKVSADHARLAHEWVLSLGNKTFDVPPRAWDLHVQPNLFGLTFSPDGYTMEIVSDGPLTVGGDGGTMTCGGGGFFLGWLTLATAFRDVDGRPRTPADDVANEYHAVRRVIPLPDAMADSS